jgi:hypothetical protein
MWKRYETKTSKNRTLTGTDLFKQSNYNMDSTISLWTQDSNFPFPS